MIVDGHHSPSTHLPSLNVATGRSFRLPPPPLNHKLKETDSSTAQVFTSLKEIAKRPHPKLSQFQDQYHKVTSQARHLSKQKKPTARLQDDYKRALKVLGEMQ